MLQKRQNDRFQRRLIMERLEDRTVLSGNVTASLDPVNGLLSVIGDSGDNAIAITQEADGTAIIAGADTTTVNGEAFAAFGNATGISIQFLDGNDSVDLESVVLPGAVTITAGIGNDAVTLQNSTFQQADIAIGTEAAGAIGNNTVTIGNDVVTGDHLNLVLLNQSGLNGSTNGGGAGLSPGSANVVTMNDVQFTGAGDLNVTVEDGFTTSNGTQLIGSSSVLMTSIQTAGDVAVNLG
ncbi:MAG TPA: hypothetical protein VKU02_23625, partial [Gemmataceae bacterium]|nr:hypothetical protein [Gemmataceae bacterium]